MANARSIERAKSGFLDRGKVIAALGPEVAKALLRAGGLVRQTSRRSMRSGGKARKSSPPGQPPRYHRRTLKDMLFFSYDFRTRSVVIGPVKLGVGTAPRALEFGGRSSHKRKGKPRYFFNVAARPYMAPALAKEMPKFAAQFRNIMRSRLGR